MPTARFHVPQRSAKPSAETRPNLATATPRLQSCLRHPARDSKPDITPRCVARGSGKNYLRLRSILLDDSFFTRNSLFDIRYSEIVNWSSVLIMTIPN